MTVLRGKRHRYCDGLSHRSFLQIGSLGVGGLTPVHHLRPEAAAGARLSQNSMINNHLSGGPSHQDMCDLKPDAPREIRGEFKPIATNVPGIDICELMPRLAGMMDKVAVIRSLHGCPDQHASDLCLSGFPIGSRGRQLVHPLLASALSKLEGPLDRAIQPFVGLTIKTRHAPYSNPGLSGFLGHAHAPFQPDGDGMANMRLNRVTLDRLSDRKSLLQSVDRFRRAAERVAIYKGLDAYTKQAFDVLTSSMLVDALDLDKEDSQTRDRYGRGSSVPAFGEDAGPHWMDQLLTARRLVEAGVSCVTLSFDSWDRHGANFSPLPIQLAIFDQGITALVQDMHDCGLLDDVSVVAWGEFGRTPRINKNSGCDHWAQVSSALLSGGGIRTGQVIGSTNQMGKRGRCVRHQQRGPTLARSIRPRHSCNTFGQTCLMVRRLVEAGMGVVTFNWGGWDSHSNTFGRGMDEDVAVVMWGEFGRTLRINKNAGRDHWPQASCAYIVGGGIRHA